MKNDWFENVFLTDLTEKIKANKKFDHTLILSEKQEKICARYMSQVNNVWNEGLWKFDTNLEYMFNGFKYVLYHYGNYAFLTLKPLLESEEK